MVAEGDGKGVDEGSGRHCWIAGCVARSFMPFTPDDHRSDMPDKGALRTSWKRMNSDNAALYSDCGDVVGQAPRNGLHSAIGISAYRFGLGGIKGAGNCGKQGISNSSQLSIRTSKKL